MEYTKEKMAMTRVLMDVVSIDEYIDARETMYLWTVRTLSTR